MPGLLLIFLIATYLSLAFWLLGKVNPFWKKGLVLVLLILIPTADEFYYSYKLNTYCKNEAGFKIYKKTSRREGLVDNLVFHPSYLEIALIGYVEKFDIKPQRQFRFERQKDGSIKKIHIKNLTAPYKFERNENHTGNFLESELKIFNRKTGEVLGKLNDLNFYGGWFRHGLLGSLSDSGATLISDCGISEASKGKFELINKVFSKE